MFTLRPWQGLAWCALLFCATPATGQLAPAAGDRLSPLEVTINGAASGTWPLLEREGNLYAPSDAFEEWRLQLRGDAQGVLYRGARYFPLSSVPGYASKVDFATQSLQLVFSPQAFAATRLTRTLASRPQPDAVLPSVFFNYDLNYSLVSGRASGSSRDLGALAELGGSNDWGVLTTSLAARNLTGGAGAGVSRGWTRLETTFTRDFPDSNLTLRAGDTSTRMGLLGRSVYFGGLQLGTNYGLTPGFVTQPLPLLAGSSSSASTVELYVNGVLRQVSNVPAGPFALDNFPLVTGGGEARLVVRDILGRETVIVQSFFSSAQLLAPRLNDWSVELGAVRRQLGTVSNDYGTRFASGTWRRGLSSTLTAEGRAELSASRRTSAVGVIAALPLELLGRAAWMTSRDAANGTGRQWLAGAEKQWLRSGIALQVQGASRSFRDLAQDNTALPAKLQVAGNANYATVDAGSFGIGFARTRPYDTPAITTVSANYSVSLPANAQLNLTYSRVIGGGSGTSLGATLIIPLDARTISTTSVQANKGQTNFYTAAMRNPATDEGGGWRLLGGLQQDRAHAEAGGFYQNRYGRTSAEASVSSDQRAVRLGAAGGMVLADGSFFLTRRVDGTFGLAEVAGYADIGVGLGSSPQTRTGADGRALLPRLVPYQNNSVRLDPSDLPINAEIDSIEQITVPRLRSAVKIVFPVRSGRGALAKIVFDDGEPAPAGAIVRIDGDKQEFYVARRGEAFITGLQADNQIRLSWKERECGFRLVLPAEQPDQIPRVGPFFCAGVAR